MNTDGAGERRQVGAASFRAHPIIAGLVFVVVVSALFLAFPGIDLWFSGLFHEPGGFTLTRNAALRTFRQSSDILVVVAGAWLILWIVLASTRSGPRFGSPRIPAFLLATLAIGPGLVVNVILKDHWGRPRPVMVDVFGGHDPYVEVWRITDFCDRNCSFVSGEASAAAWLFLVALFTPPRVRVPLAIAAGVYAVPLSLNRIAFGAHFLSDVLLAWGLTLLVAAILYRLLVAAAGTERNGAGEH